MCKPPHYVIHSRHFPDGREQHRVEKGRFLCWIVWLGRWWPCYTRDGGHYEVAVFNTRAQAEAAIREDWQQWQSSQPAIRNEQSFYDPMEDATQERPTATGSPCSDRPTRACPEEAA